MYTYVSVFHKVIWPTIGLIASYLALHSSLIVLDGAVNYDYIVTSSINSLLSGSSYISNDA